MESSWDRGKQHGVGQYQASVKEPQPKPPALDWQRLLQEFEAFQLDPAMASFDPAGFAASLVSPPPAFVESFLQRRMAVESTRAEQVRALYGFLLQKRYEERLNLLHFVFHIFDERTRLAGEIVDQTPFPHEDGTPAFRHFQASGFALDPSDP
jgi:hypothetical protein